jgi:hypothetical protein
MIRARDLRDSSKTASASECERDETEHEIVIGQRVGQLNLVWSVSLQIRQ